MAITNEFLLLVISMASTKANLIGSNLYNVNPIRCEKAGNKKIKATAIASKIIDWTIGFVLIEIVFMIIIVCFPNVFSP